MARRLFLLRHAKAEMPSEGDDVARALTERGRADAARVGAWLGAHAGAHLIVAHSSAVRSRQTAEIALKFLSPATKLVEIPAIYEAEFGDLLGVARQLPDLAESALIVGHNPGLAEFALRLCGSGDAAALKAMARTFPTAALAVIGLPSALWRELSPGAGVLERFITPEQIEA